MEKEGVSETYLVTHFLGTKYGNGNRGLRHADPLVGCGHVGRSTRRRSVLSSRKRKGVGGRVGEASGARSEREQRVWAGPQGDHGCEGGACGRGHRHKLQEGWASSCARRGRSLGRVLRGGWGVLAAG